MSKAYEATRDWRDRFKQRDLDGYRAYRAAEARQMRTTPAYKRSLDKLRREVVAAYGGKCECCGERNWLFLTIDHIYNDGAKERGSSSRAGVRCYAKLRKLGFPKDRYRLLCFNCNCGRARNNGICPHQMEYGITYGTARRTD